MQNYPNGFPLIASEEGQKIEKYLCGIQKTHELNEQNFQYFMRLQYELNVQKKQQAEQAALITKLFSSSFIRNNGCNFTIELNAYPEEEDFNEMRDTMQEINNQSNMTGTIGFEKLSS
jgi:hypothetical protein